MCWAKHDKPPDIEKPPTIASVTFSHLSYWSDSSIKRKLLQWQFTWYIRSHDYKIALEDGGPRIMKHVCNNDCTHVSVILIAH